MGTIPHIFRTFAAAVVAVAFSVAFATPVPDYGGGFNFGLTHA